jgi:hypothetical protein
MLLGVDLLAHLRDEGLTSQQLAAITNSSEGDVRSLLEVLVREELVSGLPSSFVDAPGDSDLIYTITPQGRERYALILDRYAEQVMGDMSGMGVLERFILLVAEQAPSETLRTALVELADNVPEERFENDRRSDALVLARAAVGYAQRALDADEGTRMAYAQGLRSLPTATEEQLGYVAGMLRESYAPHISDERLSGVVERVAATCEAAWDLRILGPADPETNISEPRTIAPEDYIAVAENSAMALWALVYALAADPVDEIRAVIGALRPR